MFIFLLFSLVIFSCTDKHRASDNACSGAEETENNKVSENNNKKNKEVGSFESLVKMSQPETVPSLCYVIEDSECDYSYELVDSEGDYIYLTDHRILDNYTPEVRSKIHLKGVALQGEDGHRFILETVDMVPQGVKTVPFTVLSPECHDATSRERGIYSSLSKVIHIEELPTIAEAQIILNNIDQIQQLLINSPSDPLDGYYWCQDFGEWSNRWDCYVSHPAFWIKDPNTEYVGTEPDQTIEYLGTRDRAKLRYVKRIED